MREAAIDLNTKLRNLWDAKGTFQVDARRLGTGARLLDGGGQTLPGVNYRDATSYVDVSYAKHHWFIPGTVLLAHEVGHAWVDMIDRTKTDAEQQQVSVQAENDARRVYGCTHYRPSHGSSPPTCF